MSLKRFALATVLAVTGFSLASSAAQANCNCIDNLTHQLMPQVRQMEREYLAAFQGGHEFRHGLNDMKQVADLAAHFHETAHRGGTPAHLRSDIEKLDQAYHHLEATVSRLEREATCRPRTFRLAMAKVGGTIHNIQDMVVRGCGCNESGRTRVPGAGRGPSGSHGPMTPPQRSFTRGNERFSFPFNR